VSTDPLVSIGLPVFNGAAYLKECIETVLSQTFSRFELIISDNASTDATAQICLFYAGRDPRIRYVRQSENIGPMPNFEYVLRRASCEHFMWIAADDRLGDAFVGKLYAVLVQNPDFSVAMTDVVIIDGRGAALADVTLESIRVDKAVNHWPSVRRMFFRNPTSRTYFCIYGLFRRQVLLQSELNYRGRLRHLESLEIPFLAQVALTGKIGSVPGLLWFHRHHEDSFSIKSDAKATTRKRIDNILNISSVLFSIAGGARLATFHKIELFWTISWSLAKGLVGMIPGIGSLYRKLLSLRRG
jgi:glycosyltransferase involved in cell wall biosynthesis